jgi:hypothetical protein
MILHEWKKLDGIELQLLLEQNKIISIATLMSSISIACYILKPLIVKSFL